MECACGLVRNSVASAEALSITCTLSLLSEVTKEVSVSLPWHVQVQSTHIERAKVHTRMHIAHTSIHIVHIGAHHTHLYTSYTFTVTAPEPQINTRQARGHPPAPQIDTCHAHGHPPAPQIDTHHAHGHPPTYTLHTSYTSRHHLYMPYTRVHTWHVNYGPLSLLVGSRSLVYALGLVH